MNRRIGNDRDSQGARRRGIASRLRGHGGLITFLAVAGLLGIMSGFALATPKDNNGNPPAPCGDGTATRIDSPSSGDTTSVEVIGGATLTFVFDNTQGGPYQATWTADAPFTGTILVKAGSDNSNGSGGETTFTFSDATAGTVFSPFINDQGQTHAISHVDVCGTGTTTTQSTDTTLTETLPDTTTTITEPNTTSTVTGSNSTVTTTEPDTTTTVTDPNTTTTVTGPNTTSTITVPVTTTTTGPDTTVTNTVPCQNQQTVIPRSLTTITIGGTTITQTEPGSTETTTVPGTTDTVTQEGTTSTVTQPGSTITQSVPGSTETTTVPGSTEVSTIPGTTQTVTDCTDSTTSSTEGTTTTSTISAVAGTTTSGGQLAGHKAKDNNGGGGNAAVAGTAAPAQASGSLPFTGLHVPLLILVGLGMAGAGVALRRKVGSLD
jgi:hypothetical protein